MSDIQPIVANLPATQRALANKYAPTSIYNQVPSARSLVLPLALYDQARANRGLSPLGPRQSAAALQTLRSGQPTTPPRKEGFFRDTLRNLRELVSAIPKLPMGLYHEAQDIPSAIGQVPGALAEGNGPLEALGNVANLPGFRMIPGAYVAGAFGDEGAGLQQLVQNPLFTGLDILPVASGVAKTTRAARAAEAGYAAQVEALTSARMAQGYHPSTAVIPPRPRALQTALTRTVNEAGELTPNLLGRAVQSTGGAIAETKLGNALTATFRERDLSRIFNRGDTALREAADPRIATESLRIQVPGGAAAIPEELAIRDMGVDIQKQMDEHVGAVGTPERLDFYQRLSTSKTPDGTPIAPEMMTDLTPAQRAIAREIRDFQYKTAAYTDALPGAQSTRTVKVDGTPETYDYRSSLTVSKAQAIERSAQEILEARQAALATADSPSALTREQILERLEALPARRASGELTKRAATDLENLYNTAMESAVRPDIARVVPMLKPLTREYPTIPRLIDHLQNGRWADANRDLKQLSKTRIGRTLPIEFDDLRAEVSRLVARDRTLARTAHVDERYVARAGKVRERVEGRAAPARFDPLIEEAAREATRARVKEVFATDPDLDTLIRLADEGIHDTLIARDPRFQRWVREDQAAARKSWKALRDAGHDPIFFQRVTPQQARRQSYIRLADAPTTLGSVKKRMMDATPYVQDAGIIVNQASLDILQRVATNAALEDIATNFGRSRSALVAEYQDRLLATGRDSGVSLRTRLDDMISRRWVKWDPGQYTGARTSTFAVEGADDIYVPRAMAENLKRMYEPPLPKLTAAFDPIMNVFRTSVLPLALRWQLNNAIGGSIVTAVTDPMAFREAPNVIKHLWGERKNIPEASERFRSEGAPPTGIGSMDPEMRRWERELTPHSPLKERVAAAAQYGGGAKLAEFYNGSRNFRLSKITDPVKKLIEGSYGANQFVDDIYRSMMGESARKRAMGKGYSKEASQAIAAQSIRRTFQAWDEMTPMERSVMRSIVPFYGFAAYATKFVLRYPFDHPLRASVLSSITNAELEDALTGLPEHIREMILLGDPRANGVVKALNISPFNPFGGVPSMFTVAGFLGQLNPVITGALESIGVNVQQGGPQLYPEMRYDPESGRLVADPSGNLVSNIFGNVTPQLQGISSLLGWNDQFNETLQRDPAAAGRMLMGNFGLPVLFKDVDVGEQLIRSEIARFEDQEAGRKEALSTGDLGILDQFPGLAAYGEQVRALEASGALDTMRPEPESVSLYDAQIAALTGSPV